LPGEVPRCREKAGCADLSREVLRNEAERTL